MAEEGFKVNEVSFQERNPKSDKERAKRRKSKNKKRALEVVKAEEQEIETDNPLDEGNSKSSDIVVESAKKKKIIRKDSINEGASQKSDVSEVERVKKGKKKRKRQLLQETSEGDEAFNKEGSQEELNIRGESEEMEEEKHLLKETTMGEKEQVVNGVSHLEEGDPESDVNIAKSLRKKKKQLLKETAKANKRGVCYLSRIPPHMDHVKLRHILSHYGDIQRIYLAPEDPTARVHRKRAERPGRGQAKGFSEGWVEFANRSVAKRVANMLNGEQIGGRKRSQFYYDILNIKYLSKFKWDDLTEEIAYKNAVREQKIALEISAAKRERDFFLAKVDQSHALSAIEERIKKKQNIQLAPKVIRPLLQREPVVDRAEQTQQSKPKLSKDILAGVFSGSL